MTNVSYRFAISRIEKYHTELKCVIRHASVFPLRTRMTFRIYALYTPRAVTLIIIANLIGAKF